MTPFTTTRGAGPVSLRDAVLSGLGADGSLFVPSTMPSFAELGAPPEPADTERADTFQAVARWAAPAVFPSAGSDVLSAVVDEALTFPVPLVEIDRGRYVLELFHGPTHAFKDIGARVMAALMRRFDSEPEEPRGAARERTILVATSGDTGGAVANAFHGSRNCRVVVLFPSEGVSARQRRQMTTLGENVQAVEVAGTFDDCQRMVKAAFQSDELRSAFRLTSANSINVGRLLPQSLYYLHAAVALGAMRRTDPGPAPAFVVPSGNLGNLCAGLVAHQAGMPAERFVAATNVNRGFVDYLHGETFSAKPSVRTSSNAMDVGLPSNLERIEWLYRAEPDRLRTIVHGEAVADADVSRCIRTVFEATGYVLDPHSAVAFEASSRVRASIRGPVVVLATAHPAKFPDVVEAAIGRSVPVPENLVKVMDLPERSIEIAPTLEALSTVLHRVARV